MAAPAGTYNIIADQGSTFTRQLVWKNANGTPINLTGYTARMQVRETFDAPDHVLELTTSSGITLGGALGTIDLLASASTMAGLTAKVYVYDLELVSGATVTRLVQGSFHVRPEVTK